MADRNLKTTGTGKFNVAANWKEGIVPVSGDYIWLREGSQSLETGLAQSGIGPGQFVATSGYSGNIGTDTALGTIVAAPTAGGTGYTANDILNVSEGDYGTVKVLTVDGGGVVQTLQVAPVTPGSGYSVGSGKVTTGGTGTGCTIEIATIASKALTFGDLDCAFRFAGQGALNRIAAEGIGFNLVTILDAVSLELEGAIAVFNVYKGTVIVRGGNTNRANVWYLRDRLNDANVTFEDDVTITLLQQSGGVVETNKGITDVTMSEGKLTHKGGQKIGRIRLVGPCILDYQAAVGPDDLLVGPYALFDASNNVDGIEIGPAELCERGKMDLRNGRANITFSSYGLSIVGAAFPYLDDGRSIDIVAGT